MISIRCHTKHQQRICCCSEGNVKRHPGNRFFTRCHVAASRLSHKAFLPPFRMTTDDKFHPERCRRLAAVMKKTIRRHPKRMWRTAVVVRKAVRRHPERERRGSITVVRKAVRCHQSHRFFTRCHVAVSRLSYTAFLPPFRMTTGGKGVIMGGTLIVIRSGGEKFMEELVKTVKRKI